MSDSHPSDSCITQAQICNEKFRTIIEGQAELKALIKESIVDRTQLHERVARLEARASTWGAVAGAIAGGLCAWLGRKL